MKRLERAGFYANAQTDPVVAAAEQVLKQPLVEADEKPVDSSMFRDQFYKFQNAIGPLRENLTRDIARLERNKAHLPHVAPAEIKKRRGWLEGLDKIERILDQMMHGE